MYKPSEIQLAINIYNEIEKRNNPLINTVLVCANSFITLKNAYPNYFMDITEFLNNIKQLYRQSLLI